MLNLQILCLKNEIHDIKNPEKKLNKKHGMLLLKLDYWKMRVFNHTWFLTFISKTKTKQNKKLLILYGNLLSPNFLEGNVAIR